VVIVVRLTDSFDGSRRPARKVVERCEAAGRHPGTAPAALAEPPRGDSITREYVREVVAAAPPLTPEQVHRLRTLLLDARPVAMASRAVAQGAA